MWYHMFAYSRRGLASLGSRVVQPQGINRLASCISNSGSSVAARSCDRAQADSQSIGGLASTCKTGSCVSARPYDCGQALPDPARSTLVGCFEGWAAGFSHRQGFSRGFASSAGGRGRGGADGEDTFLPGNAEGLRQGASSGASGGNPGLGDPQDIWDDPSYRVSQQGGTSARERQATEQNAGVSQHPDSRRGFPRESQRSVTASRQLDPAHRAPRGMGPDPDLDSAQHGPRDSDGRQEAFGEGRNPRAAQHQGVVHNRPAGMHQNPNMGDRGSARDVMFPPQQGLPRRGLPGEGSHGGDEGFLEGDPRGSGQGLSQGPGSVGQAGPRFGRRTHVRTNLPPGEAPPRQVRLVFEDGTHEIMGYNDALRRAAKAKLDLLVVALHADPPVCRLALLDDMVNAQVERRKAAKQRQLELRRRDSLKEVRVGAKIASNDLALKLRQAQEFLDRGHRVRLTVPKARDAEAANEMVKVLAERAAEFAMVTQPQEHERERAARDSFSIFLVPRVKE